MSAGATVAGAVQAVREGAFEYLQSPVGTDELNAALDHLLAHLRMKAEGRGLRERLRTRHGYGGLVGRAPEMEKLYRMISKAAFSAHPVLILGESGTGKELVARSIHYSGPHRDKPFIPVDCGSLVPTLIESELFGYVRGAFTGANRSKEGLLAIADGGTVFLDEVGELPPDLQAKLLRALQEKEIRPVGATHAVKIDVRILAATNRELELAVDSGNFRKDRRCASAARTCRCWPSTSWSGWAAPAWRRARSPARRSSCSWPTTGRAMCASWRIRCSARAR